MTARAAWPLRLRDAAMLVVSTTLLCSAALYNRFPLVWPDTGSYLSIEGIPFRSVLYSAFVYPAHWTGTLWPVVIAQSALMSYLLRLVLRKVFGIVSRTGFLVVVASLCALSSLPWYTGFVMADIFGPMLVMGLFLMVFCADRLTRLENWFVLVVTFLSAIVHLSHIPIAIGLLTAGVIARIVARRRMPDLVPHLMLPSIVIGAGFAAVVFANYLTLGVASFSPGGYAFQLARLIEDGEAVAYLRENCATQKYDLCQYLDQLPMKVDYFLWPPQSPFGRLGGFMAEREEGRKIVRGTIEAYPLWTLESAISNTLKQLTSNESGAAMLSFEALDFPRSRLPIFYPAAVPAFLNSRQNRGELFILPALVRLHGKVVIFSVFCCFPIAILLARNRRWLPLEFLVTVVLAFLLNAFVMGAFAEPSNRYGGRMVWLLPLVALASWRQVWGTPEETGASV